MNIRPYPEPLWIDQTIADRLSELEDVLKTNGNMAVRIAAKIEYLDLTSEDTSDQRAKWIKWLAR
jgi:hypothetical protein